MLASPVAGVERVYENDVVYKFASSSNGLVISVGKVLTDANDSEAIPHIEWYLGDQTSEAVDIALRQGKIFLLNREVYIGSLALVKDMTRAGLVIGTKHTVLGLVEKVEQGGTRRKYIVPGILLHRLEKLHPFKIGNYVYSEGWIGKVANVFFKVLWVFDQATNIATGTLPIDFVEEFQLKQGMTMDKLPDKIIENCALKTSSWNPLTKTSLPKKPATLTEISTSELEVCWIESDAVGDLKPAKPDNVIRADNLVKVFHIGNRDWKHCGPGESFKMSWTPENEDKALSYEKWQTHMLLSTTGLESGEDPPLKRIKGDSIFNVGEQVLVTPVALQTTAAVSFSYESNVINHIVKSADIAELGNEIAPRHLPSSLPTQMEFKTMDLVRDKKPAARYGFVASLDPSAGEVMVKWIYKMAGDTGTVEKYESVQKSELVHHPLQSEFNPKVQEKIVMTRDKNLGTFRGINSSTYKAVVRLVGTFEDKEYWPHDLLFLNK